MSEIKYFQVGGYVRDQFLKVESKDIDYTVVAPSFNAMIADVKDVRGCEIFQEKRDFYTVRARHPIDGVVDFVWARKEGPYSDGRRPDWVESGTIEDDLARRDFTMNAIAVREDCGSIIDPYNGRADISRGLIRCVKNSFDTMMEDSLRVLRAVRFSITKKMELAPSLSIALHHPSVLEKVANLPSDRIRQELMIMFKFDSWESMEALTMIYGNLGRILANNFPNLWFKPTIENK